MEEIDWNYFVLTPIVSAITITTILGNILVLLDFMFRFVGDTKSRTPTQFFITNLALCDFLVGLLILPFLSILEVRGQWEFGYNSCLVWIYLHCCLCAVSILSTFAISIERYIGVQYPIKHRSLLTPKIIFGVILSFWIIGGVPTALAIAFLTLPDQGWEQCDLKQPAWAMITYCLLSFHGPMIMIIVLYTKIYRIAATHIQSRINQGILFLDVNGNATSGSAGKSPNGVSSEDCGSCEKTKDIVSISDAKRAMKLNQAKKVEDGRAKQAELAKKLLVLVGILLVSYFPFFTAVPLKSAFPALLSDDIVRSLSWFRYFNSCINPFIYFYAVPAYRKSMKNNWVKIKSYFSTA